MPFSFPSSPTIGQQSTQNGRSYTWSGSVWELTSNATTIPVVVNQILSYTTVANFPSLGSSSSYYIATDTSRLYQWTGSLYVEVGPPMTGFTNAQAAINLFLWSNFR